MNHRSKASGSDPNETQDGSSSRKRKYPFDYTSSYSEEFSDTLHTTVSDIFTTYEKTQGTGHLLGSEYQYLMCALYALKCCCDNRVLDFELTTNNNKYSVFDDITIDVKLKNHTNLTFVFQLKHGEPQRNLTIGDFARQKLKNKSFLKNPYCLAKHIEFIKNLHADSVICILFTNNTTSLTDGVDIDFETNKVTVRKCDYFAYADLLVNTEVERSGIFDLKISSTNSDEKFSNQFYLFTNQDNVYTLRLSIEDVLKKLVKNDIYSSFDHFMRHWWAGSFVLTKTDIVTKLTELSLSPFVKSISGEYNNKKSKQFAKCIMNFDISIVDGCDNDVVIKIWEDAEMLRELSSAPKHELVSTFQNNIQLMKICLTASKFALTAQATSLGQEQLSSEKIYKVVASLSDLQISKVLWYLDEVPLIVKVDDDSKEPIESVFQLLDGHFKKKKFVFLVQKCFERNETSWKIFRTLTDLVNSGNNDLYMYIVNNFYVSLQEKPVVVLKDLLQLDTTISDLFGVKELLHMTQKTLFVGKSEEVLPDLYIPRSISAVFVDTQKLVKSYENSSNILLIINCEKRYEFIFKTVPVIDLSLFLANREYDKIVNLILLTNKCTIGQFDAVCQISGKAVYLFQNFNEKSALIMKKGDSSFLEEIKSEEFVEDVRALKYFTNPLNYVCAHVGTGKSTLFTVLSKKCPQNVWSIFVNLRNHRTFLRNNPDDEEMLMQFLQDNGDPFFNRFKPFLVRTKKLYVFLDELDQIEDENIDHVLNFVRRVSCEGASVWISTRDHLQERIVETLNVVPLQIVELNEDQQRKYLSESFQTRYLNNEIEKVVDAIFRSVSSVDSNHILSFPLSLFIITQIFNEDRILFERVGVENILPLSLIYKWLFDGIVEFFFKKISLDQSRDQLEDLSYVHHEQYQVYSLRYCLRSEDFSKLPLNLRLLDKFSNKLKSNGDKLGIIRKTEPEPTFIHQQYAEYFTALWLSEHLDFVHLLQQQYFSEKGQTLRFLFDTILAEENVSFLCVISRNIQEVHENFDRKDRGGRSLLHLACSYGMRYPTTCTFDIDVHRESESFIKFLEKLFSLDRNFKDCDELFSLTCFSYAVQSRCLYPVEKLLQIGTELEEIDTLYEIYSTNTIAFYASRLGYSHLLRLVVENDSGVISQDFGGRSLLELAVLGSKDEYKSSREGNVAVLTILLDHLNKTDVQNTLSKQNTLNKLLDLACEHGCYDMIKFLIERGSKSKKGDTVLHLAAKYGTLNKEMLGLCKQLGIAITTFKADRKYLFDIAYEKEDVNLLTILLKEDPDSELNMTPLDYAIKSKSNKDVIDMLSRKGIDINARNSDEFRPFALQMTKRLYTNADAFDWNKEETQLSSHFQNNLSFGNTSGEKMEIESISKKIDRPSAQIFHKRPGTTNRGMDYEFFIIANLVLKLLCDDSVEDFDLSASDENFYDFDDVVISVKTEGNIQTYAMQIKHSSAQKKIVDRELTTSKGQFSLTRYFKSFQNMKEHKNFCNFIIFTNRKFGIEDGKKINPDGLEFPMKILKKHTESFINTSSETKVCYKFEAIPSDFENVEELKKFLSHFFLYTNQEDVFGVEKQTFALFQSIFSSDKATFNQFLNFIKEWTFREGKKLKLNKMWVRNFVSLSLLAPFIKPISFGPINEKMKLLQNAVSNYSVSIFEEETYKVIKYLWGDSRNDTLNLKEVDELRKIYRLSSNRVNDINDLDDILFTKILWLQGKCPLIVTENPSVLRAIELCPHQKFILLGECPSVWQLRPSVFQNLSKLNAWSDIYKNILTTFKFSIQGKKEVNLEYLLKQDVDFLNSLTPSDLIEILEDNYQIGNEESLPDPYVVRFLSRNIISLKYLESVNGGTFILISCLDKHDQIEKYNLTDVSELAEGRSKHSNIYYCASLYPFEEFEKLCTMCVGIDKHHHFRFFDEERLEWLQSKGELDDLDYYSLDGYFLNETEFFDTNLPNKINLISGHPGIGKTQLLRHFKNQIQSLATMICPNDINELFSKLRGNQFMDVPSEIKELLLEKVNCKGNFGKKVVKMLFEKHQIVCLWDALDEIVPEFIEVVVNFIRELSTQNVVQWITCRGHVQKQLEAKFGVLARNLRPLDEEEQKFYIQERLRGISFEENVGEIVANAVSSLRPLQQDKIFGFPLQIYIFTELLRQNKIVPFSQNKLSLVDIYRQFVDLKYDTYFREKLNVNLNDSVLRQVFQSHKKTLMESYERTALRSLFSEDFLKEMNLFGDDVNQPEDPCGFVVETKNNVTSFIHSSFAEYFAACYLQKHFKNVPNLKIIFEEKYTNVRFFFDLLLANQSSAHIAVLYNNIDLLDKFDESQCPKDLGGRSALHLAASWGKRYPLLDLERRDKTFIINDKNEDDIIEDEPTYKKILLLLLDKCQVSEYDSIFKMTPLAYSDLTNCIFAKIKLLRKESKILSNFDDSSSNVLYYAAKFGYDDILDLCKHVPFIVTEKNRESLLHLAAQHETFFTKLLKFYKTPFEINFQNRNGQTPLHYASQLNLERVRQLLDHGADLNIADVRGYTALHAACKAGQKEIVRFLIECGADPNASTRNDGSTPLHLATKKGYGEIVRFLIECGADLNASTRNDGSTPLHLATKKGYDEIVRFLIECGADLNAPARNDKYASPLSF